MRLLFATHNLHKTQEIRDILKRSGLQIELLSLQDLNDEVPIVESGNTLQENALIKAQEGFDRHGIVCFSDDTGLEVEALDGAPGVYSARYAGESCDADKNIDKLLANLNEADNRSARFKTVVALVNGDNHYVFEGSVDGVILNERKGVGGFGYDPIFQPEGYKESFAEMSESDKNAISHRGRAISKLIDFLKSHNIG